MKSILVCVDPGHPERMRSAVEQVARLFREEPCHVHLLLVKPQLSGHVSLYFDSTELNKLLVDWGREELQPACAALDAARVPFTPVVRVGQSAKTIAEVAREFHCERIVFGTEQLGFAERVFGSIAQQVRHMLQAQGDPQVIGS